MVLPFFGKKPPRNPGEAGAGESPSPAPLPPAELSSLDFSDDAAHTLARDAGLVEVREVGAGPGAVYEEAAVLYADRRADAAETVLNAVLDNPANQAGEGVWMMLLDLYRLTGQRQRFESRVLDYATRFERSPPPWRDLSSDGAAPRAPAAPLVNLSGPLSAPAANQFEQIAIVGRKSGAIRLDLGLLRSVDEAGCAMFRGVLRELASERVAVSLLKAGRLAELLGEKVQPGRADAQDAWLLLLELLQHTGEQERFEELAVDYAVTFEESPPSWEAKAERQTAAGAEPEAAAVEGDEFCFEGEVTGAAADSIRKLAAFAATRQRIEVDCSRLRRLDFVSAGMLFNILATLKAQGKQVTLRNVNAMVGALLRVMSVDQVAQVTLRG